MNPTREEILKAAVELFSERGYENTSIRDICSKAGVNVAAVNYHFKGKSGLGDAVVEHLFENISEQPHYFANFAEISTEKEWKNKIKEFIRNFISDRDKEEYRNFYRSRLIFLELDNPSPLFELMYEKYLGPLQKNLIKLIGMGLPTDATEEEVAMWVITLTSQCVIFRKRTKSPMDIARIDFANPANVEMVTEHIASTLFSGLRFNGNQNN